MAEADSPEGANPQNGWRRLGVFWLVVLLVIAIGTGVIEWLGPPGASNTPGAGAPPGSGTQGVARPRAGTASDGAAIARNDDQPDPAMTPRPVPQPVVPILAAAVGRDTPGPIADPDPALLEPASAGTKDRLPRISPDGRTAMQLYAAGFDRGSRRPRVGLLLAGIGLNEAESDAAIRALPGGVSLAISPYAPDVSRLLATARVSGHEYLIAIPLEPVGFPLNDPGPLALLTSAPTAMNTKNLRTVMARIEGYVGATGIVGTMRGERMAAMTDEMGTILAEFAARGLLYIDPREGRGAVPNAWGRHVSMVIDDPADRASPRQGTPNRATPDQTTPDRASIGAKLQELEQRAKDHGSALGLVMRPTPVAVARIAAWTNGLTDRGVVLTPVSALALPPDNTTLKLSERTKSPERAH